MSEKLELRGDAVKEFKDLPKGVNKKALKGIVVVSAFLFALALSAASSYALNYNMSNTTATRGFDRCLNYAIDPTVQTRAYFVFSTWAMSDDHINQTNETDDRKTKYDCGVQYTNTFAMDVDVQEDPALIGNITFESLGYGNLEPRNITEIWVWNSSNWVNVSVKNGTQGTNRNHSYEITEDFTDYINDGNLSFMITGETQNQSTTEFQLRLNYFGVRITEASAQYPTIQTINDTYVHLGEAIYVNVTLNTSSGDMAILQTNESGSWKGVLGVYNNPRNLSNVFQSNLTNFTYYNVSKSNIVLGLRIWYNDTTGNEFYTPVNQSYLMPYVDGQDTIRDNVSTFTSDNSTHIKLKFGTGVSGSLDLWIANVSVDGNNTCPFYSDLCSSSNMTNTSNYCRFRCEVTGVSVNTEYFVSRSAAFEFAAPPNIPAAIGVTTILTIVVIYTYVTRRKSSG